MATSARAPGQSRKQDASDATGANDAGKGLRRRLVEQQILDRAADLFAERGVAGTTLQDVANSLGISRPALYYYVRSKKAILERLVENLSGQDARALDAIRRRRRGTPAEKLYEMAHQIALNASTHPKQSRILTENKHQLPKDLAEADRARYGVFRQAEFGDIQIDRLILQDILDRLIAIRKDILDWDKNKA